jgi:DNA-binding CsgD family transcriptional regulator
MKFLKKGVFYLLILQSLILFSQENLVSKVSYFKDTADSVIIKNVKDISFAPLSSSIGFNDAPFWFKIELKKEAKNTIYLQIKETFLHKLELYDDQATLLYETNKIKDSNLKITLNNYSEILYAKVLFDKHSYIDFSAYPITYLEADNNATLLQRGGYYTLILIFVILNLFFSFFFKDKLFLWYILFLLSVNLGIALYDNTIASLVQDSKQINYLLALEYWICPVSAAIFCIKFLDVKEFFPKLITIVKGMLFILTLLILVFLITSNFKFLAASELIGLSVYIGSWVLGFVLIKKHTSAKYYVLGYSVLYFTAFLYALSVNFGLHFFPLTINHLKIGVILEIIVLTFAIMQRAKMMLQENETKKKQLTEYIKELEVYKEQDNESSLLIDDGIVIEAQKFNLTPRETDVLLYLTKGLNNQQIADELFISVNTIKFHTRNIYEKMNVKKRAEITSKLLLNK